MKRKRHSAEEIIKKLREAAVLIASGKSAEVSERRACRVILQPRSTQRDRPLRYEKDAWLIKRLRRLAAKHPRYGYRCMAAQLKR